MRFPRRLNLLAARPDRSSLVRFASFRWAALPITDRRWTAPMAAAALGFGIFAGVAIGPGTEGTRGADGPIMVQVPPTPDDTTAAKPDKPHGDSKPPASSDLSQGPNFTGPSGDLTPTVPDVSSGFDTTPYTPIPVSPATSAPSPSPADEEATEAADSGPVLTALAGTVVRHNARAGSYTVADEDLGFRLPELQGGGRTAHAPHHEEPDRDDQAERENVRQQPPKSGLSGCASILTLCSRRSPTSVRSSFGSWFVVKVTTSSPRRKCPLIFWTSPASRRRRGRCRRAHGSGCTADPRWSS